MEYAREFTTDFNKEYLSSILNNIDKTGISDESRARAEGKAGGLGFQASMGSEIGLAREGTANRRSAAIAGFNQQVAGMQREERLTAEERAYKSREQEKANAEQEKLANMGYAFQSKYGEARDRAAKIAGQQGMVAGIAGGALAAGVGGYFGGLG